MIIFSILWVAPFTACHLSSSNEDEEKIFDWLLPAAHLPADHLRQKKHPTMAKIPKYGEAKLGGTDLISELLGQYDEGAMY